MYARGVAPGARCWHAQDGDGSGELDQREWGFACDRFGFGEGAPSIFRELDHEYAASTACMGSNT